MEMKKRMYWSLAMGCAMMALFGCSSQQSGTQAPESSVQESTQDSGSRIVAMSSCEPRRCS